MPDRTACQDAFVRCLSTPDEGDFYGPVRPALPAFDYVTPGETPPKQRRKLKKKKLPKGCHCPRGSKPTQYGGCFKMKRVKIKFHVGPRDGGSTKTRVGKRPIAVKMVCR